MPRRLRAFAPALAAALSAAAVSGCFQNSYQAQCTAEDGAIQLAWTPDPAYQRHRVYRVVAGGELAPVAEVDGAAWTDAAVAPGTQYHYVIRPLDESGDELGDAGGVGACSATAVADEESGPDPVADLVCRAKSGKVDLAWSAVPGAASYRVLRSGTGGGQQEIGDVANTSFADVGLVNGQTYLYVVRSVDAAGESSSPSNEVTCTPEQRVTGTPPPVAAAPVCRAKRDKVDVTWTPVEGAAYYRVARATQGGAPVVAGEVVGSAFADFGLPLDVAQQYAVISVSSTGAEAAASVPCDATPRDRDGGDPNQPPIFLSEPLTSALEEHLYYDTHATRDPEEDPVALALVVAPGGMQIVPETGFVTWTPVAAQVGTQPVEVRATDARGAWTSRVFLVDVAAFDPPPRITSVPVREGRSGQAYLYDVEAWDAKGDALSFGFASPAPDGMTIDAETGAIAWSPTQADAGERDVLVRVSDPAGNFDTQQWRLSVAADPLVLAAPSGSFTVRVGETLELGAESNYARARYFAKPLPPNASFEKGRFRFTPTAAQVGRFEVGFYAVFAAMKSVSPVTIEVVRDNLPPVFGPLADATVSEGASLRLPVSASDPDGDAVIVRAPGLSIENAHFDEVNGELVFSPSFEQAGSYDVTFEASDGSAAIQRSVVITVDEAQPPVDALALTVDPPQSPTFVQRQTLRGSVTGEVSSTRPPPAALVTGMAPTNVAQGRSAEVTLTGLRTEFAPGATQVTFGAGITVESVEVLSPTSLRVRISVAANAEIGVRAVRVQQGRDEIPSVVAFRVEQGVAQIRGRLVDSFTGAPLAGARVTLNGTQISVETDADGNFALEGAPPGDGVLVITTPNYEVVRADVAVVANQTVDLGEPIAAEALARPATPPGSLPRAATVASVLDRGLGSKDGGLSQEDAEALVVDAYLSLPTRDVGVIDESGAQLNPRMTGSGILSLKPDLVEALARRWREGHVRDLGEVIENTTGTISVVLGGEPSIDEMLDLLQREVDNAWQNPSAPDSVLPILLFNEGTSLSTLPPILTAATSLNVVQEHLFMTAFLVQHFGLLNRALDDILTRAGLDPASFTEPVVAAPSTPVAVEAPATLRGLWARFRKVLDDSTRVIGERLVQSAHAQGPPNPPQGPNQTRTNPDGFWGLTPGARAGVLWDTFTASLLPAFVAAIFAVIAAALFAWVTGGAFVLLSVATLTIAGGAFASGLAVGFLAKLWAIGTAPTTRVALTPESPRIESFALGGVEGAQRAAIVFDRSPSDLAAEANSEERFLPYVPVFSEVADLAGPGINPQFLQYDYHLWRYPSLEATGIREGTFVSDMSLPVPGNPRQRQFLIRADRIPDGRHFFRVVAVQYYDNFWTRSIFAGGNREVYSKEFVYEDAGVVIPNGLDPGQKDGLAVVGTLSSESIDARVAEARTEASVTKFAYDAATEGLTSDIVRGQGRFREFAAMLQGVTEESENLRRQIAERPNMQRHADALGVIDEWIRDSIRSGRTTADAGLAVRNPFSPVSVRLQSILGNDTYGRLFPEFERIVVGEMEVRARSAVLMRQQEVVSRLETDRADLEALVASNENGGVVVELTNEPLPGESGPPRRVILEVQTRRGPGGEITYVVIDGPEGINTLDDVRQALTNDLTDAQTRLQRVEAEIESRAARLDADADVVQRTIVDVPGLEEQARRLAFLEAEEATIRAEMEELEKSIVRDADQRIRLDAERAEVDRRFAAPAVVEALDDVHKSKKGLKVFASAALDAFGVVSDLAEAPIQVREGIRVIPSAPSAAYVVEKANGAIRVLTPGSTPPAPGGITLGEMAEEVIAALTVGEAHAQPAGGSGFAPNFETDWNGDYHLSFFRTAADPGNRRAGFLVREHFFGIPEPINVAAGFPSQLIAQDSRGRIYLNNANSNEQYGGRIFRFGGDPIQREHVGVVNYYSFALGYARPAEPVAMAIGDWLEGAELVENLFVANIDRGGYFDPNIPSTNRILRVPVHYADTLPGFANGQNRDRIVGQPYAEHPDFRFTGPSDLVADRRNATADDIARNLYLSDEEILFVIEPPQEAGGSGVVKKLVEIPGRRWSGLAADSSGNLLFADWRAGEVFLLTAAEIDAIRASGSPIASDADLDQRAFLIKEGLAGPTDIELDNNEARYIVSTEQGFEPFNFSIVGRLGSDVTDVRLVVADHELPVTYRGDRGNVFIAGFTSDGALGKQARLKVRRLAADGRAYWERRIIRLSLFGASVLEEPL